MSLRLGAALAEVYQAWDAEEVVSAPVKMTRKQLRWLEDHGLFEEAWSGLGTMVRYLAKAASA